MSSPSVQSDAYFQQLRNRQNDLYRFNLQELKKAAAASDLGRIAELRAERAKLSQNDQKILEAEMAFQATQLDPSEAEKRVRAQTRRANALVRSIKTLTDVLESAGKMASILARLVTLLS